MTSALDDLVSSFNTSHIGQEMIDIEVLQVGFSRTSVAPPV